MRDADLLGPGIGGGAVATVSFRLLRGLNVLALVLVGGASGTRLLQEFLDHLMGAFRAGPKEQLFELLDRDVLFLQFPRQEDQRLDYRVELGVFLLAVSFR